MTRNDIIKEPERIGYEEKIRENVKNGVIFEGIEIYERDDNEDISMKLLCSNEFFQNHVYIGIQKKSDEDITKRECSLDSNGLESYLLIKYSGEDSIYSIKVTDYLLKQVGIERTEAWKMAMQNVCNDTVIESLNKIMCGVFGIPYDPEEDRGFSLYVISNSDKVKGASAILNREKLKEFGNTYGVDKILVLPSSINEMIIAPYQDWIEIDEMKVMVKEINATEVEPEERLIDQAYIINL